MSVVVVVRRGALGLTAAGVVLGLVAPAAVAAGDGRDGLAARLLRLDPGARLGANTQVATAPGARLVGIPGRVNFMVGLGPGQRLAGGGEHDQLGVRGVAGHIVGRGGPDLINGHGRRDRLYGGPGPDLIRGLGGRDLIDGGPGRDLIYGGPGRDRLRGGPGRDRLVDGRGPTTVRAASNHDRIDVADGRGDDRVLCTARTAIRPAADRGDRIDPACQARPARAASPRPDAEPPARAAQQPVTGDGSENNPYIAPCDDPRPVDCTVNSFRREPPGGFGGFWSNGYVPAYKCPPDHPWLRGTFTRPWGTALPRGVEVDGLGPIGVSISGVVRVQTPTGRYRVVQTRTGFFLTSATNWNGPGRTYKVILHCTSDPDRGWA